MIPSQMASLHVLSQNSNAEVIFALYIENDNDYHTYTLILFRKNILKISEIYRVKFMLRICGERQKISQMTLTYSVY